MKYVLIILLLLAVHFPGTGQPFQIGHISASFIDSTRGNRPVPVEIYYPADITGDNVPFAGITNKTPLIAFGHGFVMPYSSYANIRDAVVPRGYIIAFPTTEGSLSPNHGEFGKDLAFVLKAVTRLGESGASVLYGKVDTVNCVMGHSMGGGASFLALSYDPGIKAIVTFAAAETTPSAISAAATVRSPALVFAGLNDCVCPPAANQLPMYDALLSDCKHYIGITGGSHCQMAESDVACNFGESTCTPAPAITRAAQHDVIDSLLLPWLDYMLKASCAAGNIFDLRVASGSSITSLQNCTLCSANTIGGTTRPIIKVFPNPSADYINFEEIPVIYTQVSITSATGRVMFTSGLKNNMRIPLHNFPVGIYIYQLSGTGCQPLRGVLHIVR